MNNRQTTLYICLLLQIILCNNLRAQNIRDSVVFSPLIKVNLALQTPKGGLEEFFGPNTNIGCSFGWKNQKNNTIELEYNFIHSKNVKKLSIIEHLLNSQGWIIDQYGEQNLYLMYHRGGQLSLDLGKIINWTKS